LLKYTEQDEKTRQQRMAELRQLHIQVEKLNEADRQEQQRQRLLEELKELPTNPKEEVRKARIQIEELEELKQALGPLTRLHDLREGLGQAVVQEKTSADELTTARQR